MTKISQLRSLDELTQLWPRLMKLAECRTLKGADSLLRLYLNTMASGAVFLVFNDHGLFGTCHVRKMHGAGVLLSLPQDNGEGLGKKCLAKVEEWAKGQGLGKLVITNDRFVGSSFRYFEKSLGFHRTAITFTKELYG